MNYGVIRYAVIAACMYLICAMLLMISESSSPVNSRLLANIDIYPSIRHAGLLPGPVST